MFTLEYVNKCFKNLNLKYMDDNKQTPLESSCLSDGSLKQNGNDNIISFI